MGEMDFSRAATRTFDGSRTLRIRRVDVRPAGPRSAKHGEADMGPSAKRSGGTSSTRCLPRVNGRLDIQAIADACAVAQAQTTPCSNLQAKSCAHAGRARTEAIGQEADQKGNGTCQRR